MFFQDSANQILENYASVLNREVGASADDREEAATTLIDVIGIYLVMKSKRFYLLLNKEADSTLLHSQFSILHANVVLQTEKLSYFSPYMILNTATYKRYLSLSMKLVFS